VQGDFASFVAAQAQPLNTLIPGCGSAWEASHLADHRWPVTALDFSPTAVACAREVLADKPSTWCVPTSSPGNRRKRST
jgi:thiopurine S-methyltransferase